MNHFTRLISLSCFFMLCACDSGLGQSDMKGIFETDHGGCVKEGDVGLSILKNKNVHIDFYCFLDKCNSMEGPVEKGGHFYLSDKKGHYIQGQLLATKARGSWFATMAGKKCSGSWYAIDKHILKNEK